MLKKLLQLISLFLFEARLKGCLSIPAWKEKYRPSLINSFELDGYIRGYIFEDTYEHHFGQQLDPNFGTICEQKTPF